jgi:diaminopimelate decarboxylase
MTEQDESATVGGDSSGARHGPPIRRLDDWGAGRLDALADEYGTPLYVLDLDRVQENYRRLVAAFEAPPGDRPGGNSGSGDDTRSFQGPAEVYYAAKANTARPVLETLADLGAGIECASAGETIRALDAGLPADRVQYTAVNPPDRDLDAVVGRWRRDAGGLTITVGATDTIDRLAERGFDGRLCIRVNPGVGAGHHEKVATGADAKFGIPLDRVPQVLVDAVDRGFDVVGIHAHAGSGISGEDLDAHRELVDRMGELARESPVALEFVDVGGGIGVPYRDDDDPVDLDRIAVVTREALGPIDARLRIEPGRYVVADAGVLLTRVNTVKETDETTVTGVGAGMTDLLRPAMYDAVHPIRNCSADARADEAGSAGADRGDEPVAQTIAGPICESADVFATDRLLPPPRRGDLLAIGTAGAYGYGMASNYNSRPRPATVVLEDGTDRVARRRETLSDVTRLESERAVTTAAGADTDDTEEP